MMVLVIRHVALEGYKYIRRSGNIVCVFMCKVDIDSWPSYYFNGSYYIYEEDRSCMFSSLMMGHRSPESAYVDIFTLSSKEFTSCFVKSLLVIYILCTSDILIFLLYIYIYIYIYI